MPSPRNKGRTSPPIQTPAEKKLAKLKKWSTANANSLPSSFSPEIPKLRATLSTSTLDDIQADLAGKKSPNGRKVAGKIHDTFVEADSRFRISSLIPSHRFVRGEYKDLSMEKAKKRQKNIETRMQKKRQAYKAKGGGKKKLPSYDLQLKKLKADRAVNRPGWDNSTEVLYPRLDPRQLQRSRTAGSPSSQGSKSPETVGSRSGPSSPVRAALNTFPISPAVGFQNVEKKYVPSRRSLDPIRHVKKEQGNVLRVLTAMREDINEVEERLQQQDQRHKILAASEFAKVARFMANAAIARVERVALVDVELGDPEKMQSQIATMSEEMLDATVQVKQLHDVASITFVWDKVNEIEQILSEAPPVTRQSPPVAGALKDLKAAQQAYIKLVGNPFPHKTSSIQHAVDHVDNPNPLPLPSVMWGSDVTDALSKVAREGAELEALASDALFVIRMEAGEIIDRMEKNEHQREVLEHDILNPGHEMLAEVLEALETMPSTSGFQGAGGLTATYDRARAVLAVLQKNWAVEVDLTSPTHVDEVLETLTECATAFGDAAQRAYKLVVGMRRCAADITSVQDALSAEDTPRQILQVPSIQAINQFLDENVGRAQGSVWAYTKNGNDMTTLYPKAFEAHVNATVDDELKALAEEEGGDDDLALALADIAGDGEEETAIVQTTRPSTSDHSQVTDEEILREPDWMRAKVDEMTASMEQLRAACAKTRAVVDHEIPLIKARKARELAERARLKELVEEAASIRAQCVEVIERSHEQLAKVPEVEEKIVAVGAAIEEATAALEPEVDLTGPEETDAALSTLDAQSEEVLAAAKELSLTLDQHAVALASRVRRETLGRQQLNHEKLPPMRTILAEVEGILEAAHPQLRDVDAVKTNCADFQDRFKTLEQDLQTCVDVTSQVRSCFVYWLS